MTDRDGGLDELFGFGAEPAVEDVEPAEKPRSRVAWVLRNLLFVALATVVAVAALRSAGLDVPVVLIVAAFLGLRLIMFAVAEVAPPPLPKRRSDAGSTGSWRADDALRAEVRRWEQNLNRAHADPDLYSRNVLPVLAELTDERLRLRHGITRASDPRRARELLGEAFWAVLHDPRRRMPRIRELEAHVDTLERL